MGFFDKLLNVCVYNGGILASGVICFFLCRSRHLPLYMEPVSYGIATIGVLGVLIGCFKDDDEDPGHAARMAEFERLRPDLERRLEEEQQLVDECEKFIRLRNKMEKWSDASKELQKSVTKVGLHGSPGRARLMAVDIAGPSHAKDEPDLDSPETIAAKERRRELKLALEGPKFDGTQDSDSDDSASKIDWLERERIKALIEEELKEYTEDESKYVSVLVDLEEQTVSAKEVTVVHDEVEPSAVQVSTVTVYVAEEATQTVGTTVEHEVKEPFAVQVSSVTVEENLNGDDLENKDLDEH